MVWCGDDYGFDILVFEQAPEIAIQLRTGTNRLAGSFEARLVNVGNSDDLGIRQAKETSRVQPANQPEADHAHPDAFTRPEDTLCRERRDGCARLRDTLYEIPSSHPG